LHIAAARFAILLWGLGNGHFSPFFLANGVPIALHGLFVGFAIGLQGNAVEFQILLFAFPSIFNLFWWIFILLNYGFYVSH
jgi:hypothetical protein